MYWIRRTYYSKIAYIAYKEIGQQMAKEKGVKINGIV